MFTPQSFYRTPWRANVPTVPRSKRSAPKGSSISSWTTDLMISKSLNRCTIRRVNIAENTCAIIRTFTIKVRRSPRLMQRKTHHRQMAATRHRPRNRSKIKANRRTETTVDVRNRSSLSVSFSSVRVWNGLGRKWCESIFETSFQVAHCMKNWNNIEDD